MTNEVRNSQPEEWEEVWSLFAQEGREMLDLVEEMLLALESDPTHAGRVGELFRALHTFKGMARMMGLSVTESLAHHAEDLVALVRDEGATLTGEMIDLLLEVLDHARVMLDHALQCRSDVEPAHVQAVLVRLQALLDEHSGSAPASGVDTPEPPEDDFWAAPEEHVSEDAGGSLDSHAIPAETVVDAAAGPVVDPVVDPTTDPLYVQIFLELAEEELVHLHAALDALADGDEEAVHTIEPVVDRLKHAAGQMGYERVVTVLDELLSITERLDGEARLARARETEWALFEELARVQERTPWPEPEDDAPQLGAGQEPHLPATVVTAEAQDDVPGRARPIQGTGSTEALTDLVATQGRLLATHATLRRITERLAEADLIETVNRVWARLEGNRKRARKEVQSALGPWVEDLHRLVQAESEMAMALGQLGEAVSTLRNRPVAEILDPLQGLVRDAAQRQGKAVDLAVTGADIPLDPDVLAILDSPLRRLVEFAVAHGIEEPAQRQEAGKPTTGRVAVAVTRSDGYVRVLVEDDGRGIDQEAAFRRARERGWTEEHTAFMDSLSAWMLTEGLGPVGAPNGDDALDLAGIHSALRAHQGWLDMASTPGEGARFTLTVPLDTTVIDGMVVRVSDMRYVVPVEAIRRIIQPERDAIVHSSADGDQSLLRLEERLVPIRTLRGDAGDSAYWERLLVVVEQGAQATALAVDELIGQHQVLIQPLQGCLANIRSVSGCAVLGDGDVGMVLSLNQMHH